MKKLERRIKLREGREKEKYYIKSSERQRREKEISDGRII